MSRRTRRPSDLWKSVLMQPPDILSLMPNDSVGFTIRNNTDGALAYKLKTTRPTSVKPNKAYGVVQPNEIEQLQVRFAPSTDEKPFMQADRLTVLICPFPEGNLNIDRFWRKSDNVAMSKRFIIALQKAKSERRQAPKKPLSSEESEESDTE